MVSEWECQCACHVWQELTHEGQCCYQVTCPICGDGDFSGRHELGIHLLGCSQD